MSTTVVNLRKDDFDVDISRSGKWGNPFVVGRDGTRSEVIQMYENWIKTRDIYTDIVPELKDKILGCYCKPKACHGDVLARIADEGDN